jgi:hypothetical protein
MFAPTRDEARNVFFETWRKYRASQPLQGVETILLDVMLLHPEYHDLLGEPDRYRDRDYTDESNPFMHMSLHLLLEEQLRIDQPPGVVALVKALGERAGDRHKALHEALECLAEMVWHAQKNQAPPDAGLYLECLERRAR